MLFGSTFTTGYIIQGDKPSGRSNIDATLSLDIKLVPVQAAFSANQRSLLHTALHATQKSTRGRPMACKALCEDLTSLVHDCLAKHLYESAAFYADKLVTLSDGAPADVYVLAQVCVGPSPPPGSVHRGVTFLSTLALKQSTPGKHGLLSQARRESADHIRSAVLRAGCGQGTAQLRGCRARRRTYKCSALGRCGLGRSDADWHAGAVNRAAALALLRSAGLNDAELLRPQHVIYFA